MGSGSGGSNSRRGGSGPSASAGAIVTDPGLADTPFHGFGTPPVSSARPSLGGDETLKRVPDGQNEGSTFLIAGGGESEGLREGEGVGVGAGEGAGTGRGGGGQSPGRVPLEQRPQKHRKYYKVIFSGLGRLGVSPNPAQTNPT